jgi:hypothetical protein
MAEKLGERTLVAMVLHIEHSCSMRITLADIANKFEGVLAETLTRDEADRWAWSMIEADEAGSLEFSPRLTMIGSGVD